MKTLGYNMFFSLCPTCPEQTACEKWEPFCSGYPSFLRGTESANRKPRTCDALLYTSQGEMSMEEEEERSEEEMAEEEEERELEDSPSSEVSRVSSDADLLSEPQNILEGLVNPSFSREDSPTGSRSIPSSQWRRPARPNKVSGSFRDAPYSYCRSLSSSVENMAFTPSHVAGSGHESERAATSSNSCLQSNRTRGKEVTATLCWENTTQYRLLFCHSYLLEVFLDLCEVAVSVCVIHF